MRSGGLRGGLAIMVPALAIANALGYLLFVLIGRALGPADFAEFAAFWGLLFALAGMAAPIEQETARLVALGASPRDFRLLRDGLVVAAGLVFVLVVAFPVTVTRVLDGSWLLLGLVAASTVGMGVQYVRRGVLLGKQQLSGYAGLVVGEAALRVAALAVLVAVLDTSVLVAATAVVAGSFAWLAWLRRPPASAQEAVGGQLPRGGLPVDLGNLVLAAGFTAAVITGFPAMAAAVAPAGSDGELGVLLAALTLTRLPLLLMGPVQALLVPELVRRRHSGAPGAASRVLLLAVAAAVAATVAVALAAAAAGPRVVRLVYGDGFSIGVAPLLVMTAGAGLVAVQLLLTAAVLAQGGHRWVLASWGVCFVGVLGGLTLLSGSLTTTVVGGLVIGPALGVLVALAALVWGPCSVARGRAVPSPERTTPA